MSIESPDPIDEERFRELRAQALVLRRKRDEAKGKLDAALQKLTDEFGVDSIEDAERLKKKLDASAIKYSKAYHAELAKFEKEWGDVIG